jgi:hypothetical protein
MMSRPTRMSGAKLMAGYDTNLAAEYHILCCPHRRGLADELLLRLTPALL